MKRILAGLSAMSAAGLMLVGTMLLPQQTMLLGRAAESTVLLGLEGQYLGDLQEALDRMNAIRYEACAEGVPNPKNGLPLTLADYVPLQWSSDLEQVARTRAVEAAMNIDHTRPNGESPWTCLSSNGISSQGECLAWNYFESAAFGVEQWYEEKSDYINNVAGAVVGHYKLMINPQYNYAAVASYYNVAHKGFRNMTVAEFRYGVDLDQTMGTATESAILPVAVRTSEVTYVISGGEGLADYGTAGLQVMANTNCYTGDGYYATEGLQILSPITWNSSNPDVVSVDLSGNLRLKFCGNATITASTMNGNSASKSFSIAHRYEDSSKEATCREEGYTRKDCWRCGDIKLTTIPKKAHQFSEWKRTKEPTETAEGAESRSCKECGETEVRALPRKGQATTASSHTTTTTTQTTSKPQPLTHAPVQGQVTTASKQPAQTAAASETETTTTETQTERLIAPAIEEEETTTCETTTIQAAEVSIEETETIAEVESEPAETTEEEKGIDPVVLAFAGCGTAAVAVTGFSFFTFLHKPPIPTPTTTPIGSGGGTGSMPTGADALPEMTNPTGIPESSAVPIQETPIVEATPATSNAAETAAKGIVPFAEKEQEEKKENDSKENDSAEKNPQPKQKSGGKKGKKKKRK